MKKLSKKLTSRWSLKKPLYIKKDDKRYARHLKQLKTNGFSDAETWSLDSVISEFILPRLQRFREIDNGIPNGMEAKEWTDILDAMIFAFNWNSNHWELSENLTVDEESCMWKKHEEGMKLFATHFRNLWW
jgi:hypothetical protein